MNVLEQTQVKPEADHFVTFPETTLPSGIIVLSFQVSKYVCTKGIDGKAVVGAIHESWVTHPSSGRPAPLNSNVNYPLCGFFCHA
jgi:hypothetical protein